MNIAIAFVAILISIQFMAISYQLYILIKIQVRLLEIAEGNKNGAQTAKR